MPLATRALLFANFAAFMLQQLLGDPLIVHFGLWPLGDARPIVAANALFVIGFEPWQLVTYAFLHGGALHIAFNMFALWMFGGALERLWGSSAFVFYYFAAVIGAAVLQLCVIGMVPPGGVFYPTIGASGGVLGLLVGYGMMFPRHRVMLLFPPVPMPAWLLVVLYGAAELLMGLLGSRQDAGIAHFAHVGGMLTGVVIIQYWRGKLTLKPRHRLMR
jgi:membrane associated rhomboid family serine protease